MSGPGDGFVEGIGDPPTGTFDTAAIAGAVREQSGPPRMGGSRLAGHGAADRLSVGGPAVAMRVTPMASFAVADASYLRAMLGNLYFAFPVVGLLLGVLAGVQTAGQAVPPALTLTLVLVALGAFDALAGLCALSGFALVTLLTGNLVGGHMFSAPPGEQTLVFTLTGLFGLGVMWFAGANVAQRVRPLQVHREGTPLVVWSRRAADYAVIPIIGTFVIWLAAWKMPVLTGNSPQELFVTIQYHLVAVQVVALVAILARVLLEATADHHFHVRSAAVAHAAVPPRGGLASAAFFVVRAGFALMILWELLAWGWMTWVAWALFMLVGLAAWLGRRLELRQVTRHWFPVNLLRIIVVVLVAGLAISLLTRHQVNPTPMLGGLLIAIGVLLVLFAFLEQVLGTGKGQGASSTALDALAVVAVAVLVWGGLGTWAQPFDQPSGVYVAPTGAVFVADTNNNRVVLVWNSGFRQTIGDGFSHPADVVAEAGGNGFVYVADAGNDRVVRLGGYDNHSVGWDSFNHFNYKGTHLPYSQADVGSGFKDPQGVSVDGQGNVFVADTGNNRIVEVLRTSGTQRTFLTGLSSPLAVLCDPAYTQTVWVANSGAGTVLRILPNHKRQLLLHGLHQPSGLAMDPWGDLYVAEESSGQVLMVTPGGTKTIIASGLTHPRGLSSDVLGNVFVSTPDDGQVKVISSERIQRIRTHGIPDPTAVAYSPDGTVYVTDGSQGRLQSYAGGQLRTVATGLTRPVGVAVAEGIDRVWVAQANGTLRLVNPATGSSRVVVTGLDDPRQLYPTANGDVIVAVRGAGEVIEVTPQGQAFSLLSGLAAPVGVAQDRFGDLAVGLEGGDVIGFKGSKSIFLFNLKGITAMGFDDASNLYTASTRFQTVVMHVAETGRDAVVSRNFRSLTGMAVAPGGTLWIGDKASIGLFEVLPSLRHGFLTQL